MLVRRLAGEPGRDTKSVHREVTMLTATGLIERRAADEVAVGWDLIGQLVDIFQPRECANYFSSCGYDPD